MRIRIIFYAFIFLWSATQLFAQESLVVTTYYPSPAGSFNELGADKLAVNVSGDANGNQVAVVPEFQNMTVGGAHIGWSMIVGAGGGSGFAYDEINLANPAWLPTDGDLLVKHMVKIGFSNTTLPQSMLQIERFASGYSAGAFNGRVGSLRVGMFTINSFEFAFTRLEHNLYFDSTGYHYIGNGPAVSLSLGTFTGDSSDISFSTVLSPGAAGAGATLNERVRIKQLSNAPAAVSHGIGIGTSAPLEALDVVGLVNISGNYSVESYTGYMIGGFEEYYNGNTFDSCCNPWGVGNCGGAVNCNTVSGSCPAGFRRVFLHEAQDSTFGALEPQCGNHKCTVKLFGCVKP